MYESARFKIAHKKYRAAKKMRSEKIHNSYFKIDT